MALNRVYLSSTYDDLKDFRDAVAGALRKVNKQVIGMEDYVASDMRPLDKCLLDVASADVYVGIFAHRYGYIPEDDNPEHRSITELEYRCAQSRKKPCLIFVLSEDGSARESGGPRDFGGFGVLDGQESSSRRCCGNVGTRVWCGFPSAEGEPRISG